MTRQEFQLQICHEMDGWLAAAYANRAGLEFRSWFAGAQRSIMETAGRLFDEVTKAPPMPAQILQPPPPVGTNGVNGHTRLPLGKPAPAPPVGTNGVNGHTRLPLGKPAVAGRVGGG